MAEPIPLLDGTGERAGASKLGVELHLAIGLVARRRAGGQALFDLAGRLWPSVPVQRCRFHLARAVGFIARYTDRLGGEAADALVARLEALLTDAYRDGDHARAHAAYAALIDHARGVGARKVARHLISEQGER